MAKQKKETVRPNRRPRTYETVEELELAVDAYFDMVEKTGLIPTVENFCRELRTTRQALWRWENEEQFLYLRDTIRQAKADVLSYFVDNVVNGTAKASGNLAQFLLKNNGVGYKDQQENIITDQRIELELD